MSSNNTHGLISSDIDLKMISPNSTCDVAGDYNMQHILSTFKDIIHVISNITVNNNIS